MPSRICSTPAPGGARRRVPSDADCHNRDQVIAWSASARAAGAQAALIEEALAERDVVTVILDAEGDREGLAEPWLLADQFRHWLGASAVGQHGTTTAVLAHRQGPLTD